MYRHILAATDGSDWSLSGLRHAVELAATLGARLTVVVATDVTPAEPMVCDGIIPAADIGLQPEDQARQAQIALDEAAQIAGARGLAPDLVHLPNVDPPRAITAEADSRDCDLIVIGSRGRTGLTRLILGSHAAEVLASTTRPVLVVRHVPGEAE